MIKDNKKNMSSRNQNDCDVRNIKILVMMFLTDCDISFYWNNSWHGNKVYYYYYKFKIATIMHHDCIIKPWIETHDYNVVIVTRRGV